MKKKLMVNIETKMNSVSPNKKSIKSKTPTVKPVQKFLNRELSWLEFNSRVLFQAEDNRNPLLERLRFLSIFTSNLDEFVMKRIGGLKHQINSHRNILSIDGKNSIEQMNLIRKRIQIDLEKRSTIFLNLKNELQENGIVLTSYKNLTKLEKNYCEKYFKENLFPVLTPLSVDPGKPFPFISNLSYSLAILLENNKSKEQFFSRIKIPAALPGWVLYAKRKKQHFFVNCDEVIINCLHFLYPGMKIKKVLPFKITRNADLDYEEEDTADLLELIEESVKERRFQETIKLDVPKDSDPTLVEILKSELELDDADVYYHSCFINYLKFNSIFKVGEDNLKYYPWNPLVPKELLPLDKSIFSQIKQGDIFLHHPYQSFQYSVERFIQEASTDPYVLAIKMTLYRTGDQSSFIPSLIRAAENGKQVVCLVELKARFEEKRNIYWANKLEEAGVHVVYGIPGLKIHSKISLVVRKESTGEVLRYAHVGTGNYNSSTSKLYTDVSLLTTNENICKELSEVFNYLTGTSLKADYHKLLVSPINMKKNFLDQIKSFTQQAKKGKKNLLIMSKMNSLEDEEIIKALYEASSAGVKIKLIVRGFCCLRAGVKGLSENIMVYSIIGRFLEHARIFYFGEDSENYLKGNFYIGSADWMHRNLHSRVEIIIPIETPHLKKELWNILLIQIQDERSCWKLKPDGTYQALTKKDAMGSQQRLMKYYLSK